MIREKQPASGEGWRGADAGHAVVFGTLFGELRSQQLSGGGTVDAMSPELASRHRRDAARRGEEIPHA